MLNTQALALVVLEKKISHYIPMGDIDVGVVNRDPRGIVGRMYKGDYQTLLHVHRKYRSAGSCCFREEDLFLVFPNYCKSMENHYFHAICSKSQFSQSPTQ